MVALLLMESGTEDSWYKVCALESCGAKEFTELDFVLVSRYDPPIELRA